ncbi:MAG: hypothetical protein AAGH82_06025 [Pseudomonadota bacterium]
MANIFILGVTSASLSFMTVVGLSAFAFDASHAQGTESVGSVAATVAPSELPQPNNTQPYITKTAPAPKMDRTLRAFAVERLQEKLGTGLRDSVTAEDNVLPIARRKIAPQAPAAEIAPKPKRLPRII